MNIRKIWNITKVEVNQDLFQACGCNRILATLLQNRGIDTPDKAQKFLNPLKAALSSPDVFVDMQNATFMKEFLCDTTLPSWEKYSITVTFKNIVEDKTANVLFYGINGQELSGKTFSNTASAIFVTEPSVKKGVVGREYILPTDRIGYQI